MTYPGFVPGQVGNVMGLGGTSRRKKSAPSLRKTANQTKNIHVINEIIVIKAIDYIKAVFPEHSFTANGVSRQ